MKSLACHNFCIVALCEYILPNDALLHASAFSCIFSKTPPPQLHLWGSLPSIVSFTICLHLLSKCILLQATFSSKKKTLSTLAVLRPLILYHLNESVWHHLVRADVSSCLLLWLSGRSVQSRKACLEILTHLKTIIAKG